MTAFSQKLGGPGYCPRCKTTVSNLSYHRTVCGKPLEPEKLPQELKGCYPVTLYFSNQKDKDDFIKLIQSAHPGLKVVP